ncbi:nuclear transport factor 2 family protein [Halorubellus litoreus]|uniref:Nuclear transport factor 2 family protein n=1 Tax=Halorubellus litoreus TaxID=755308 RepID=A0ABD5VJY8_9EURY
MEHAERERVIDTYFDAMDTTDTSEVRDLLAAEFTYVAGDGTTFVGEDAIDRYIEEVRSLADTHHEIEHLAHGDSASFAEGTVSGTGPGGDKIAVGFCDVFEFDEEDGTLAALTVYINEK